MRRFFVAALLIALAGLAFARQEPDEHTRVVARSGGSDEAAQDEDHSVVETRAPRIVDKLPEVGEDEKETDTEEGDVAEESQEHHKFDHHVGNLEEQIAAHDKTLDEINQQLIDAQQERKRMLLVREELHALMYLHRAASRLHKLDEAIKSVEEEIKKLGEEAEQTVEEQNDLKRQLEEDLNSHSDRLQEQRDQLAHLEERLAELEQEQKHVGMLVHAWHHKAKQIRTAREHHEMQMAGDAAGTEGVEGEEEDPSRSEAEQWIQHMARHGEEEEEELPFPEGVDAHDVMESYHEHQGEHGDLMTTQEDIQHVENAIREFSKGEIEKHAEQNAEEEAESLPEFRSAQLRGRQLLSHNRQSRRRA